MNNETKQTTTTLDNNTTMENAEDGDSSWQDADFLSFDTPADAQKEESSGKPNGNNNSNEIASGTAAVAKKNPSFSLDDGKLPPWMDQHNDFYKMRPLVALHNEIVGFVNLMSPMREEMRERESLVERFEALAKDTFDCEVKVFGSQATGLCLPTSDIDVVILMKNEDEDNDQKKPSTSNNSKKDGSKKKSSSENKSTEKENGKENGTTSDAKDDNDGNGASKAETSDNDEHESWQKLTERQPLERLAQVLRDKWIKELSYLEVIENTRVPLVKFTHATSGISVDVSFDVSTGPQAASLITTYMKAMPPLRPLTFLLKYFLASRGLNEPYTGGVGSFMIQMMIVSFLQHRERDAYNYRRPSLYNLGGLLLDFLELYGTDFNYITTGISVRHDGFYFPKGAGDRKEVFSVLSRPFMMAMENALEPDMDVGKPSFRIQTLQRSFQVAHKMLLAHVAEPYMECTSILATILPPTEEMAKRALIKSSPKNKMDRPLSARRGESPRKRSRNRY